MHGKDLVPQTVTALNGVGPQVAKKLAKLGIYNIQDVLFHLPLRYQDRTRVCPIGEARPGQHLLVHGEILASGANLGRRRSLVTIVSDGTGKLTVRQFHYNASQKRSLKRGVWIQCFGEIRSGSSGPELVHPDYQIIDGPDGVKADTTLTPIYPTTTGLGQSTWHKLTAQALDKVGKQIPELLPNSVMEMTKFLRVTDALRMIHRPPQSEDISALTKRVHPAQQRLAFEELLAHYLAVRRQRSIREMNTAPRISPSQDLWPDLENRLGFSLTQAQKNTIREIFSDLGRSYPSFRLIQGDVGCGKTIIAAAAALAAIEAGFQVAVMAPTEILAEQHFQTFSNWLEEFNVKPVWLSGKLNAEERRRVSNLLLTGEAQIAIGTHALFQDHVQYKNLGLVIVDEQHRFGVEQRAALREKGRNSNRLPHQIVMTATPIPRSLAMVIYADMDISIIDEMPPNRKPAETVVMPNSRRTEVQDRIRLACAGGQKAYWVCPLINESDALNAAAVIQRAEALKEELPDLRISVLHGKTLSEDKDEVMREFRSGVVDVLVASTVIEVGVHVPEASLMVIENAERLGLSQLHQLRGRIGRSGQRAVCVLLYQPPLGSIARHRLKTLRDISDGFAIARKDLELRGPGEVLGTRQSGVPDLRIADLFVHRKAIEMVPAIAEQLQEKHPKKVDQLIKRWLASSDYFANA